LDKRLSFYDVTSRKCIRNVTTDYALSCLDYHSDGCTLLLGTMAGHLLLYDIRNAAKPVAKILNAHPGRPVNAVKFAHAHVPVPTTTTTTQQPSSPSSRASAGSIQRNGGGGREHHSSGSSSAVYDTKATTFIDNIASAAADSAPAAASTSGSFSARAPHHQQAHNATLPPSSAPSSSAAFNYSTAAAAVNQTVPSGFAAATTTGDMFSPVKDASAAAAQPASTPTGVHQLHSNRSYVNPTPAATASSLGLGFMSPLAAGGGNHASTADYGSSGGDSTPHHLQHTGTAAVSTRPAHLSTSTPNGHASTDYSSASFPASSHAGALVPAPSATSPSRGSSRSALATALQPSPSSASMHAAAAAGHSTFASPAPSPAAAAAASSRHPGAQGSFDGAAAAASNPSDGNGGALSEYHMRALRSLLDDSLHSLRSELRGAVTDLHVEMLKQFHQAQMEQQQQLEQFAQRFESMLGEVKQLRDDYQQLKHIY
jgi:hypothetical protein